MSFSVRFKTCQYWLGSVMAKLCVEGMKATYKYCDTHNIPYKKVNNQQGQTGDRKQW